jgi:P22 coat protein - gene protein 5
MANTLVTCNILAKEALAILKNNLKFASMVNQDWTDEYTGNQSRGYSPGATINIKKPPRYTYRAGNVAIPQATVETTVPITLSQGGCDLSFSSLERTISLQQMEQKIAAAVATVTNEIDRQGLDLARTSTFNCLGTPGTLPNTAALALAAMTGVNQRMDEMGAPRDQQRALVMNPALNASLIQGTQGLFNSQSTLAKQYGSGMYVDALGLNVAMDQNVALHTNGTAVVNTNTVNGAGQTGSTVTVAALNGTVTKGTKITFAGVFAVNPQSRSSTGTLSQHVVTADAASGATTLSISPPLTPTGAFQNVTASPANGATITIFGTASGSYNTNIAYHRDAFTLAMVPLWQPPKSGVIDSATISADGMNLRVYSYMDGTNDKPITRLDVLFGWAATYPELACVYAT